MTNEEWLAEYDKWAGDIPDDILDEADERFNIGEEPGQTMSVPDEYYVWAIQRFAATLLHGS